MDDDGEEKELMERLKKLSVPASDEEDEGKCTEGRWVPGTLESGRVKQKKNAKKQNGCLGRPFKWL